MDRFDVTGSFGWATMIEDSEGPYVLFASHKQALSEKDAQLAKADEEIAYLNMRVDALRRWLSKKISTGEAKDAAYQQLMEKAVGLAETVLQGHRHRLKTLRIVRASASIVLAEKLINSPEVQAWKERQP